MKKKDNQLPKTKPNGIKKQAADLVRLVLGLNVHFQQIFVSLTIIEKGAFHLELSVPLLMSEKSLLI